MKQEVFFVIKSLGGKGWGGAHRVLAILANYLAQMGYDVTIIVWQDSTIDYPLDSRIHIEWLHCVITGEKDVLPAFLKTRAILKGHKGAYLYAFMSKMAVYALIYTLGEGIHIIGAERTDPQTEPHNSFFRAIRNHAFGFMYKTVYQTPDAMAYFPRRARKNGRVIPNPITPDLPECFEGERSKEFVTFCRIDKQKNLPVMIDAFCKVHSLYPEYRLKIYGTGLVEKEISEYIKQKKAQEYVFMLGFNKEVHQEIRNAFAFLSSSDYEGLSNSMLEAMAIGLPCICTDCPIGGARMVIQNGTNGILVPVKDVNAMSRAMISLIEKPGLGKKLSENATKIRDDLNQDVICEKWRKLMD